MSQDKTIEKRITSEKLRLTKLFKSLEPEKLKIAEGLIQRAAFIRVQAEDLENDLNENGWSELFRQSDKVPPYSRARPEGQTYNTLIGNYQKIVKQLDTMLPEPVKASGGNDGFDDFVNGRDDG